MVNKTLELAKKLKALAEHGIGGEKENAAFQLKRFMLKHNLSIKDIENEEIISKVYTVGKHVRLMKQIISSVSNTAILYGYKTVKTKVILDATLAEHIEAEAKFNLYKKEYERQQKEYEETFFRAFVQKNALYSNEKSEPTEYNQEELKQAKKVLALSKELDDVNYLKQIENLKAK